MTLLERQDGGDCAHFDSDLVCGEFCCAVKVKKHHVVLSQQPCDRAASDVDVWLISEGYDTSLSHSKPPGRPQGCCRTVCPVIGHGTSLRAPTRGGLEVSRCAAVGALSPPAGRPGTPRGRPARWVVAGAAPVPPTGPRKRICPILGLQPVPADPHDPHDPKGMADLSSTASA